MPGRRAPLRLIVQVTLAIPATACGAADAPSSGSSRTAPYPAMVVPAAVASPAAVAGTPAPLNGPNASLNGFGPISLGAFRGHVAVIHFWATWCEPCKKTLPLLSALATRYQANGLAMVAVSEDDESQGVPPFVAAHPVAFPVVFDGDKAWAGAWKVPNMPSTYVVDRSGTIRFVHPGYHEGDESLIEMELRSLL